MRKGLSGLFGARLGWHGDVMSMTDLDSPGRSGAARIIDVDGLQALIEALLGRGFTVIGPP